LLSVVLKLLRRVPGGRHTAGISCQTLCVGNFEVKLNEWWLLWGLLFGAFGFAYFLYGKKHKAVVPLICGLTLMIFPYFVVNTIVLAIIGTVLIFVPYFVRA